MNILSSLSRRSNATQALSMDRILGSCIAVIYTLGTASAATKGVNPGGDNLFWIIITIGLTIFFAKKGVLPLFLTNPIAMLVLVLFLVLAYILFSAITIVYGVGDFIEISIQKTVNLISFGG